VAIAGIRAGTLQTSLNDFSSVIFLNKKGYDF